jgi:uncharacterized protein (DUF1684 family)
MSILDNLKKAFGSQKTDPVVETTTASKELPASFYIDTIEADRVEKDRFFRSSPYSPIEDRANFSGLNYFPPDPAFRLELVLQEAEQVEELIIQTSTGDEQTYYRIGTVEFEIEGEPAKLAVYKSPHHDDLFLPFRDATSGQETYGAGRYLEPAELGGGQLLVDFNLAYNPYCAYSEHYSCPLPPLENWLKVPIRAGEKGYNSDTRDM